MIQKLEIKDFENHKHIEERQKKTRETVDASFI